MPVYEFFCRRCQKPFTAVMHVAEHDADVAAVLESVGTPALDAAEADARFEAEALAAWEEYQLSGTSVSADAVDSLFADAMGRAKASAARRAR
ncbi:MAG TPA: hypothetical protein VLS93_10905 [Anaeromyxobacteraceae bacterium]|nr:hypothetical protein [Anaeromyxobacteraceae bacterium]